MAATVAGDIWIRHFGPYYVTWDKPGLGPGEVQDTLWFGWQPAPRDFTVTVTAHPISDVGTPKLAVEVAVEGGFSLYAPVVHAKLVNVSREHAVAANLYITFIEPAPESG